MRSLEPIVITSRLANPGPGCFRRLIAALVPWLAADSVGMGWAAFGMPHPLFAAFIHVASGLAFILNSARLLLGRTR